MMITIEPPKSGWWQTVWKTLIWLLSWTLVSFLVFAIISSLGTWFFQDWSGIFLALIVMLVACIVTLIGTGIMAGTLNLVFSWDYYDFAKMFGSSVLINTLLVILFTPIYLTMSSDITILLLMLAFHSMFAFFVSYSLIEIITNANYAISSLIWTSIWFSLSIVVYMIVYKVAIVQENINIYILMLFPFITSYTLIPLFHGIRTTIYYNIFTTWSNPLYVAPLSEITQSETDNSINIQL